MEYFIGYYDSTKVYFWDGGRGYTKSFTLENFGKKENAYVFSESPIANYVKDELQEFTGVKLVVFSK